MVISAVMPFPLDSGQSARVHNTLLALREIFEITFLSVVHPTDVIEMKQKISTLVDHLIALPYLTQRNSFMKVWYKGVGVLRAMRSGLRLSNYIIGEVELSPERVASQCNPQDFDLVLYEYWHTHSATSVFRRHGIPCVLDMHDILWQTYNRVLEIDQYPWMRFAREWRVRLYKTQEEAAWNDYDVLIAINSAEAAYVRGVLPNKPVLLAPMGVDMSRWPYQWLPQVPPRIGFYGSMGGLGNQEGVRWCIERIMPLVWQKTPNVEFWIIGANPPREFYRLEKDPRIHVTGFVTNVAETLASMTLILCPWKGKFGFRSRLIEAMAVGVPVVAMPDTIYGMDLEHGRGILLGDTDPELAEYCAALLEQTKYARNQSQLAREQVEKIYSFDATYEQLARDLYQIATQFRGSRGNKLADVSDRSLS